MNRKSAQLRNILEKLYARYNRRQFISTDPLIFAYKYSNEADIEVAGLLAAELAFGRVRQIQNSLADLFGRMGKSPSRFVGNFGGRERAKLKDFKHRFITGDDISDLLALLRGVLEKHGSIESFFAANCNRIDTNIIPALSAFSNSLLDMYLQTHGGGIGRGLSFLLPRPEAGSACKRLNLYLRWMVREDGVDLGLWQTIDKARLIVPLDVHMHRLCRILGLHKRSTVSLSAAKEITERFAEIEPCDPVKYDFALSRIGIIDNCTGRCRSGCEFCELFVFCRAG